MAHSDKLFVFGYILKAEPKGYPGVLAVDCGEKSQR